MFATCDDSAVRENGVPRPARRENNWLQGQGANLYECSARIPGQVDCLGPRNCVRPTKQPTATSKRLRQASSPRTTQAKSGQPIAPQAIGGRTSGLQKLVPVSTFGAAFETAEAVPHSQLKPRRGDWLMLALIFTTYYLAGRLGLRLAIVYPIASPIWPPTGVALAALLIWGYRMWPAVFAGSFLVNAVQFSLSYHGHSFWLREIVDPLLIASGNTCEALLGAYLVDWFANGRRAFEKTDDTLRFAALGGLGACVVGATVGTAALEIGGFAAEHAFGGIWTTWWLGDATGALIVAPVFLLWAAPSPIRWNRARVLELTVLAVSLLVAAEVVIFSNAKSLRDMLPLLFLCFPFLLWPAIRFGQREAATSALFLSCVAVVGSLAGHRFAPDVSLNFSFIMLQFFMASMGVTALVVAATIGERRRAAAELNITLDMLEETIGDRTKELGALSGRLLQMQDEERRRLAREFHDSTAQKVVAIGINAGIAQQEAERLSEEAQRALGECVQLVDETVREIRTISYVLHPPLLDEAGLGSALRAFASGFSKRSGIDVEIDIPEHWPRASEDAEIAVFRVAQECLGNIQRHSGSSWARVCLKMVNGATVLEVEDRGRGIPPEIVQRGANGTLGVGISGMRERLRQLGGALEIASRKPGTLVRATLPNAQTRAAEDEKAAGQSA
jgi:two-component system, NarL family, sensor histidine kinase FusK